MEKVRTLQTEPRYLFFIKQCTYLFSSLNLAFRTKRAVKGKKLKTVIESDDTRMKTCTC